MSCNARSPPLKRHSRTNMIIPRITAVGTLFVNEVCGWFCDVEHRVWRDQSVFETLGAYQNPGIRGTSWTGGFEYRNVGEQGNRAGMLQKGCSLSDLWVEVISQSGSYPRPQSPIDSILKYTY